MIHYHLRCGAAHEFDAWFRDSAAFEGQAAAGLLECPQCGNTDIARALMAPALMARALPRREHAPAEVSAPAVPAPDPPPPPVPDHVRAVLQRMRAEVERRCEYVGPRFASEARRIHDGASEQRGIYGEATPAEAEALADDGIEVSSIPWLPRADA